MISPENSRNDVELVTDISFIGVDPGELSPNGHPEGHEAARFDIVLGTTLMGNVSIATTDNGAIKLRPNWISAEAVHTGIAAEAFDKLAQQAIAAGYKEVVAEMEMQSPLLAALGAAGFRLAWIENYDQMVGYEKSKAQILHRPPIRVDQKNT